MLRWFPNEKLRGGICMDPVREMSEDRSSRGVNESSVMRDYETIRHMWRKNNLQSKYSFTKL